MGDILYTYKEQIYANITNKCNCQCTFCIRSHQDAVGDSDSLWHEEEPELHAILKAINDYDLIGYKELVYCGYGEPTCALENLLASSKYAKKEANGIRIRLNTNGLGNLYHKVNIVPRLAEVIDAVSISLNAPSADAYDKVTRPGMEGAFEGMLSFARECRKLISDVQLTVVDVLPKEDLDASRAIADSLGIRLRIRKYS